MGIFDIFSKKGGRPDPEPKMNQFLAEHHEKEDRIYVTKRANGRWMALAFSPLARHRNKYNDELEDGAGAIFLEEESALALGEWFQGTSRELNWDQGKPVGKDPFPLGRMAWGSLLFTQVGKQAPFHDACGLTWWADPDGTTLRTLLHYMTLPEARLIWTLYQPGEEMPEPVAASADLADLVGIWNRYHMVEGTVVIDPSEGSGFSKEGDEYWSEDVIIWDDGTVTVKGPPHYLGRVREGAVEWTVPESGTPPEDGLPSCAHFRPYNGPVTTDGSNLVVGGCRFARVLDTEQ